MITHPVFRSPAALATWAVAIGVASATISLRTIVLNPWSVLLTIALAGLTLVLILTRALAVKWSANQHTWLRTVVPLSAAMVLAGIYLVKGFALPDSPLADWQNLRIPQRLFLLLTDAIAIVGVESAPLDPVPQVVFLITVCAFGLLLLADVLAHSRVPLLAIVPMLTMWLPTIGLGRRLGAHTILIALFAILLLLVGSNQSGVASNQPDLPVASPSEAPFPWQRLAATCALLGLTLGTGALAANAVPASLPARRLIPIPPAAAAVNIFGDAIYGSGMLLNQSTNPLFSYTTSTGRGVGNIRFTTYTLFDGKAWRAMLPEYNSAFSEDIILDGGAVNPQLTIEPTDNTIVSFTIEDLRSIFLPITAEPRQLVVSQQTAEWPQASGWWHLDTVNDQARPYGFGQLGAEDRVTLTIFPRPLTPELLRSTVWETGLPEHLALPFDEDAYLRQTAYQIAGSAPSRFDAAVTIQNYLRNPARFSYTTEPPAGSTGRLVTDFLETQEGFCVHFATTMVMLSRAMGIPARLAVGFQAGTQNSDGSWTVTAHEAHSWPELYFGPTIGWVAFEPTPAAISGPPPLYTILGTVDGFQQHGYDHGLSDWEFLRDSENQAQVTAGGEAAEELSAIENMFSTLRTAGPALWIIPAGLLAIAVIIVLVRMIAGKRQVLTDEFALTRAAKVLAKRGIVIHVAATPRQLPQKVASDWQAKFQTPPPMNLVTGLATIANSVEQTRYGSIENSLPSDDLRAALKQITKARPAKVKG